MKKLIWQLESGPCDAAVLFLGGNFCFQFPDEKREKKGNYAGLYLVENSAFL